MGETIIKQLTGFQQVRVRDLDGVAKIEVDPNNISAVYDQNYLPQIVNKLKMIGFSSVIIDQDGYKTGKLNLIYNKKSES
jgi:uncharacterized protein